MIEKLEKKIGRYAIKNLIYYILGAYALGYILYLAKPEWYSYIILDPSMVMKGQVWRLFTWVCTMPQSISFFLIFMFIFYLFIGRSLEQTLGSFRYNLYIFSGWFFTTVGTMLFYWITEWINGPGGGITILVSTHYINLTSFLMFAVIYPDTKVLFFAIIPVKMKILAWIDAAYLAIQVISGLVIALSPSTVVQQALEMYTGTPPSVLEVAVMKNSGISLVVSILISVLNFLIFFVATARKRKENKQRRQQFQAKMEEGKAFTSRTQAGTYRSGPAHDPSAAAASASARHSSKELVHTCSVCGRTNIDHPELMFRYCSKCSGNHEYCQDHLFTHEHIK